MTRTLEHSKTELIRRHLARHPNADAQQVAIKYDATTGLVYSVRKKTRQAAELAAASARLRVDQSHGENGDSDNDHAGNGHAIPTVQQEAGEIGEPPTLRQPWDGATPGQIVAAKDFVEECGGFDEAERAIDDLRDMQLDLTRR